MINKAIATALFNAAGLKSLGLTSCQLSNQWSSEPVEPAADSLQLRTDGMWRAPASGTLHRLAEAHDLTDLKGSAITGPVLVLRMHPQAHLRLRRLYVATFGGDGEERSIRPVPYAIAMRVNAHPDGAAPLQLALAGDDLGVGGALSFHDEHGLIIDPLAVAVAWHALITRHMSLRIDVGGPQGGALERVATLSGEASGRYVHAVDLHGGPAPSGVLRIGNTSVVPAQLHRWPDEESLDKSEGAPASVRWGYATYGSLEATPLTAPRPTVTLTRDFLRVAVVDLKLHLTGNRTAAPVDDVPAPDPHTRAEPAPVLRDTETLAALLDGQAVLGAVQELRERSNPATTLVVSPIVDVSFDLPARRTSRWPADPAPLDGAPGADWSTTGASIRDERSWTARFIGTTHDVELTLAEGGAPAQSAVRVFPRELEAAGMLADAPSTRRGDGGSAITPPSGPTRLVLRDPLRLGTQARPASALLRFDVVVVPRPASGAPRARLIGGLKRAIEAGGSDQAPAAATRSLGSVPEPQRAASRAPILGLSAGASPSAGTDGVLRLLSESTPREAPRYPTMARNDVIVAGRTTATDAWEAVSTAGWLAPRTLRAWPRLGNPGNPAGPEEHVVGLAVGGGRLAYDLARAALRRTLHVVPRLAALDGADYAEPTPSSGSCAASLLQTISPVCEDPELAPLLPSTAAGLPDTWEGLSRLIPGAGSLPAPTSGDRWVAEVKREAMAAVGGRRDAQWALRWQVAHARTLIYIETMLFGSTASADGSEHRWDLVAALRQRLAAAPNLRVIVATPRHIPFGPGYEAWSAYFEAQRVMACDSLREVAPARVHFFHPLGFPGRPELIRGSTVVVDDVWALVGSSTLSRRGLTFDGGLDVVFVDRTLSGGVSAKVSELRRRLMARVLGKDPPANTGVDRPMPDPGWVRLARMRSAFDLVGEVLEHGGEGVIQPLWRTPLPDVAAQSQALADPEGRDFRASLATQAVAAAIEALSPAGV